MGMGGFSFFLGVFYISNIRLRSSDFHTHNKHHVPFHIMMVLDMRCTQFGKLKILLHSKWNQQYLAKQTTTY